MNNQSTEFKEYLDSMPRQLDEYPLFFKDEELMELKGSPFILKLCHKDDIMTKDYELFCENMPGFKDQINIRDFKEIMLLMMSRKYKITIEGNTTGSLVPLADMFNHERKAQTFWYYSDEKGGFVVEAMYEIQKGEEIFVSYGKKPNSLLWLNYGFMIENNFNDVRVLVELDQEDPLYQFKVNLIDNHRDNQIFDLTANFVQHEML